LFASAKPLNVKDNNIEIIKIIFFILRSFVTLKIP
jgi:hypothetical protein